MIDRIVEFRTRSGARVEVTVRGRDDDQYVDKMGRHVLEAPLECARVLLGDDAVIVDAGANVGLLTVGFALLEPRGRVIAIEPSPTTFADLERNVDRATLKNVELVECAVGERPGTLELFDSPWFSAGSFVKSDTLGAAVHDGSVEVDARTLDDIVSKLALERVDFVKLDVEGHELPALRGARETFERFRPLVVLELNLFTITSFGDTLPFDFLNEIRAMFPYVYDFAPGEGFLPVATDHDAYKRVQMQFIHGRSTDLLCAFEPLTGDAISALSQSALAQQPDDGARQAELEAEVHALRAENDALRASTSWRVTAPLRRLTDLVRRR